MLLHSVIDPIIIIMTTIINSIDLDKTKSTLSDPWMYIYVCMCLGLYMCVFFINKHCNE